MFLNTQHSWSIVVAKFSKTKFPCNSTAYGFKTLFFINWSRGFCRYACINSLIVVCRSFDSAFLDLTPTQKQKLEVAKSSRNCNALISVICSFTMSICRPSFTLLQSSVSRRPCRLPVRWLFVPTNDNRARRLRPLPVL